MKSNFPVITHISQLDHLREFPEFIFKEETDLTIVFYAVAFPDTFGAFSMVSGLPTVDAMIRRECRGIVFDVDGNVHSRPYHKFFNLNEREETQENYVDFDLPHAFLEKLDGSMIRPVICNNKLRLFTKAGLSDVALEAEQLAMTPDIRKFMLYNIKRGYTTIWEYVGSPNYAIVLKYNKPELILTAIRNNKTGEYEPYNIMSNIRLEGSFNVVNKLNILDIECAVETAKTLVDAEGYVVRFDNGSMLKVKSSWYCRRHSAKEKIHVPRKLVRLILENDLDDIMPDLSDKEQEYVSAFSTRLEHNIVEYETGIKVCFDLYKEKSIKDGVVDRGVFAKYILEKAISPILFRLLDGKNLTELVVSDIIKSTAKTKSFERYEFLI